MEYLVCASHWEEQWGHEEDRIHALKEHRIRGLENIHVNALTIIKQDSLVAEISSMSYENIQQQNFPSPLGKSKPSFLGDAPAESRKDDVQMCGCLKEYVLSGIRSKHVFQYDWNVSIWYTRFSITKM